MHVHETIGQAQRDARPPDVDAALKSRPATHGVLPAVDRKLAARKVPRAQPRPRHYGAGF